MKKEQLSGNQAGILIFLTIMATVIIFVPGITAEKAKQSAWLATLLASAAGFISLGIVWLLGRRFPGYALPQYSELIIGKSLGKIMGLCYVLFFLIVDFLVIREFSDFLNIMLLRQTPGLVLIILVTLVGAYIAAKGIEVIARMAQFILPLFVFTLLFIMVLAIPEMDWGNLLPFMESGIMPIAQGSLAPASWYGEIAILVMLLPIVNQPREVKRKGIYALLASAFLLTLETLVTLMVLSPYLTADLLFPFSFLARYIEAGSYLQRLDTLILVLWVSGIVLKVALLSYLVSSTTAQVFDLKNYLPVLYPLTVVLIIAATLVAGNTQELTTVLAKYWPPLGLVFEILLPVVLLMVAMVRKKHGRNRLCE